MKRIFIAIELPKNIKEKIIDIENKLDFDAKYVKPENIHLTLAFLGNVEEEKLKVLESELEKDLAGLQPFKLEISGLGGFPQPQRAHTLWIGVEEQPKLASLELVLRRKLQGLEFQTDSRPFTPHITIARLRKKQNITEEIKKYSEEKFGSFEVNQILIFESKLNTQGPEHIVLKKIELGKNDTY